MTQLSVEVMEYPEGKKLFVLNGLTRDEAGMLIEQAELLISKLKDIDDEEVLE